MAIRREELRKGVLEQGPVVELGTGGKGADVTI